MGFNIKKISTSFDFTVQLTYITYKSIVNSVSFKRKKRFLSELYKNETACYIIARKLEPSIQITKV